MLEKPDLPDAKITACLQAEYGLRAGHIEFLPLGADRNTAVYRVISGDGTPFFVKLRAGIFDETSVWLPKFLHDQGITQIIAPFTTKTGQLWASLENFKLILYPFVEGLDGYEVDLTGRHWVELGAALKRIHTVQVPAALEQRIRREDYSARWREIVKSFLERVAVETFDDPIAEKTAAFLKTKREQILGLVERTERLARPFQSLSADYVLCHSDLHAGNILIDSAGALYIVDWDDPILAPKERDLMYAGGGQFGRLRTPKEEENLFFQGYGQTRVDPIALAYYRYERIVQDLAVECEQIFLTKENSQDRERELRFMMTNFLPNNVLEIACQSDQTPPHFHPYHGDF